MDLYCHSLFVVKPGISGLLACCVRESHVDSEVWFQVGQKGSDSERLFAALAASHSISLSPHRWKCLMESQTPMACISVHWSAEAVLMLSASWTRIRVHEFSQWVWQMGTTMEPICSSRRGQGCVLVIIVVNWSVWISPSVAHPSLCLRFHQANFPHKP